MPRRLAVLLGTALLLSATPAVASADAAAYQAPVDATFPVADPDGLTTYRDDYHDPRGGGSRVHRATDIGGANAAGLPIHAAVGGRITFITGIDGAAHDTAGYMITVAGDDGRRYSYIHLGPDHGPASAAYAPGIADEVRVERGQLLGYLGSSGNASASWPHLHFEIEDRSISDPYGSHRMNPYATLRSAEDRGDLPGQRAPATDRDGSSPPETSTGFADVPDDHEHADAIRAVANAGIAKGGTDGRFRPQRPVDRGQMATFLDRALDLDPGDPGRFPDVPTDHPHADGIDAVATAGIARGHTDGRYAPRAQVRRDQMATFLASGFALEHAPPSFPDVSPDGTHAGAIGAIAEADITRGGADGRFRPDGSVTRGQMASFLARALDLEVG